MGGEGPAEAGGLTVLTGPVQVSHFLEAELLKNKGEPLRIPHESDSSRFLAAKQNPAFAGLCFLVAAGGFEPPVVGL